jgi:cytidylate kinase
MGLITIRGHLGSGAPEIGKLIASRLHIDYVDREIIAEVAKSINWSEESAATKEMPNGSLFGRIVEALGRAYPAVAGYSGAYLPTWELPLDDAAYFVGLQTAITTLAENKALVLRGRGSQFILKDFPGAIHILVGAPLELRIKRVMESSTEDEAEAKKEIERFDSSRRVFTKRYFQADLEDPLNYDLVINTADFSYEAAASIIIRASSFKENVSARN